MTKRVTRVATPSPPLVTPRGTGGGVSRSENPRKLKPWLRAWRLSSSRLPDPSYSVVIERVDVAASFATVTKRKLTSLDELQKAIEGLNVDKTPGPKSMPNIFLKYLPQRPIFFLVKLVMQLSSSVTFYQTGSMLT